MPLFLQSALGVSVFIGLAWAVSEDRRAFPWRIVLAGLVFQFVLAAVLLKLPWVRAWVSGLNEVMHALERATEAGTAFVFGYLGGGPLPFTEAMPGASFVIAFRALPLILVVSALSSLLFYWRILPFIVRGLSRLFEKTLGIGGAVGLSAAADVFVGMVEAPLLVRPYLGALSRGELFSVMSCGMATIAGTVMVLYASILGEVLPEAMGHILTASLINTPGALLIAAIMVPSAECAIAGELGAAHAAHSSMDAITSGTIAGVALLINIIALLLVFVALVSLADAILGLLPHFGGEPVTLRHILGVLMAPLVWLAGIPWGEAQAAGALMGTKTVLNELVAYLDLARLPKGELSERSVVIMTYALCGFAKLRQPRDPDRGSRHHGSGATGGDRRARPQVHPVRNPGNALDGCHRRHTLVLSLCADAQDPAGGHRRLSPDLRGGILQAPWPNHALQPTPWIAFAFQALLSGAADLVSLCVMTESRADSDAQHLAEVQEFSERLSAALPDRIQAAALTLKSKLPFKALSIRELLFHRMAALSSAAVDLFKQKRAIPAVILTRAIVETVAVMFTFHKRLDRFLKDKIKDIGAFDDFLMRCLLGGRHKADMPTPTNILTLVDHVERTLPGFRNVYDGLCEYAHPNWAGTFGAFGQVDKEKFEVRLGPAERSSAYTVGLAALSGSLMIFERYYNDSGELVRKFNDYFEGLPS